MIGRFQKISDGDLREIALAIRSGRLSPPYTTIALKRIVSGDLADLAADLQSLAQAGFGVEQVAATLELIRADRQARPRVEDVLELVTTGPEVSGTANRDTSVVVRELFANARDSVLVAGYAIYQGQRVFQALANRMVEIPGLKVRMFLDIQRGHGDTTAAPELIRRFSASFRSDKWPKDRPLPDVFFDPRSLEIDPSRRPSLHAKCVVVDGKEVFVSSANFTEAAQQRNLEIGVLIHSAQVANWVIRYFDELFSRRLLVSVVQTKPGE
jgi:phosphatidylserine/phosphatidylglycerophosphate/cardiolipin synthase-like enzyme